MNEVNTMEAEQGMESNFFRASTADFGKIPGSPIAYWVSESFLAIFSSSKTLGEKTKARQGLATGDNGTFARLWYEVSRGNFFTDAKSCLDTKNRPEKWFPYNKGGEFRRWYGNIQWIVNWKDDGAEIREFRAEDGKIRSRPQNTDCYFQAGITWSDVTSGYLSVRSLPAGCIYDISGHSAFPLPGKECGSILAYLNTNFSKMTAKMLNPTLHFQIGDYQSFPYPEHFISSELDGLARSCIDLSQEDWNSYEDTWDFTCPPLLQISYRQSTLQSTYQKVHSRWQVMTLETRRLEQENNRLFIEAYGLQDELTPDVPLKEITLTCNPHYRYGGDKTEDELEALLLADTMREFLSYAVGCMFGRYSLDKPGLVLANQGDTLAEYLRQVAEPRFMPDDDNVIPLLDGEWFADDVTERFRAFLRVTFGDEHYAENLAFIEAALGKDVRKYFLKDFYADHVKRYKKRPIYWLFASPKGTFSALIYLHRYRPDTVSVVLQYLRDFRKKLAARLEHLQQVQVSTSASQGDKTKAGKEADVIRKQQLELDDYERDTLYPLATEQVQLDLDDGVKVNYLKLGLALKKIAGLDSKVDD